MPEGSRECARCGALAHGTARYCPHCGAELARQPQPIPVGRVILIVLLTVGILGIIFAAAAWAVVGACFAALKNL